MVAASESRSPVEFLSRIQLFTGLAQHYLKRIADIGVEESYKTGEKVFAEGDRGDKYYLILEGAVRISRNVSGMGEEALAILKVGDSFGEMSLIDDAAPLAAVSDAVLVVVRGAHTTRDSFRSTLERLGRARSFVMGAVLNDVKPPRRSDQAYEYAEAAEPRT